MRTAWSSGIIRTMTDTLVDAKGLSLAMPRLVLLPGMDGTGKLFKPLLDAMGPAAPVTVVNYASPEVSTYEDCRSVAERLLPAGEPYILVGESFSGPVAISIAAEHPSGLCGLALVGSFVASPRAALRYLSAFLGLFRMRLEPGRTTELLLLGRYATPGRRIQLREAIAAVSSHALRARLDAIASVDVSKELSRVSVPVLYVRATADGLVPPSNGEDVVRLARRATISDIEAPHLLLQCAPVECARLLTDFARNCAAERS